MCCKGSFRKVCQNLWSNQRSAVQSIPLPFCFGLQHLKFVNFGRYSTASWNHLVTYRVPLFSFRALRTGRLGQMMVIRQLTQWLRPSLALRFHNLSYLVRFFLIIVHSLFLNQNTWNSRIYISYWHKLCIWGH